MDEKIEHYSFLLLLLLVTGAFFWLLQPFFGAIFWAAIFAILFYPVQSRVRAQIGARRRSLAALVTLLLCLLAVIGPFLFILASVVQEGVNFYQKLETGEIDPAQFLERLRDGFPRLQLLFQKLDLRMENVYERLTEGLMTGGRFLATQVVSIGQNTLQFGISFLLMLYLLFFLLRDGDRLVELLVRALPLGDARERLLFSKFSEVTRATIKGNLLVALVQGALGGGIFWVLGIEGALLWGVVMVVLSLLPALGAALVWLPVAIYFLATGEIWEGVVLMIFGVAVISLVDNVLRPILVGRDTKLPDYLVLLSTLGGLWFFGLTGFVAGPLIASLFLAFWGIFIREFQP